MSEKMLVTQALDERDLLVKKINDKIDKLKAVDIKKRNEDKTAAERKMANEFEADVKSSFQQINDLIARYQRLDAAIIASNAKTMITTSAGEYSVAAAIALRNRLKGSGVYDEDGSFESRLAVQMERQYNLNIQYADTKNKSLESQAETMRLSILGKDTKVKDEKPLEVVDAYIRENTTEVIDPLDAQKKVQELREKNDALLTELDTQIKVSNATTMIEF